VTQIHNIGSPWSIFLPSVQMGVWGERSGIERIRKGSKMGEKTRLPKPGGKCDEGNKNTELGHA